VPPESTKPPTAAAPKRRSGVVVPHEATLGQRLAAWVVFAALRGIAFTLRSRWVDNCGVLAQPEAGQAIYAIWHNRLALCLEIYRRFIRRRGHTPGMAAMVSASRDGGFLATILECYGVQPVRGSSSRRGPQALLELIGWAERGYDLALTPDGPRGPRYVVQEGVISLAQITGLPIIPASYSLSWRWQAGSWDGFLVPLPFARWEIVAGKTIRVPREANDAEREALRLQLEAELREISRD